MYYELTAVPPEKSYQRRVFHQANPGFAEYLVWLPSKDEPAARPLAGYQFSAKGFVWRRSPGEKKGALFHRLPGGPDALRSRAAPIDPADLCAVGRYLGELKEFLEGIGAPELVPTLPPWGDPTAAKAVVSPEVSVVDRRPRAPVTSLEVPAKCFTLAMQRGEYFLQLAKTNRFIYLFSGAFEALQVPVPLEEVERLAILVHSAMEQGTRAFHNSGHAFDMCEGLNPRQVLATLFHDVIYYQVDGDFPAMMSELLTPIVRKENGGLVLREIASEDLPLQLCAAVFAFLPGQTLPLFGGMNEFLSAVVAVRLLQPYLPPRDLLAVVACIEATIPFRGLDAEGRAAPHTLAARVRAQFRRVSDPLTDSEFERLVREILQDALGVAKRDVAGFAEPNPAKFLSGTWRLIEESNAPLCGVYTLRDYRAALARMEKFLGTLNPENIFHQYDSFLGESAYAELSGAARQNIRFACAYLAAKITAVAVIEALAVETGGNCPASMFLGDIRSQDATKPLRMVDFLPSAPPAAKLDYRLLGVLEQGRAHESSYDLTSSPLTAFMYRWLGHEATMAAYTDAKRMFAGELPAHGFLQLLDREMVEAVIDACAHIAISRRGLLRELKQALPWKHSDRSCARQLGTSAVQA